MKIYVCHPKSINFQEELYKPIRESNLVSSHHFIFPHEQEGVFVKSKDIIKNVNLVVAEVSEPATGQGIELGWADAFNTPIICFFKAGHKASGSLKVITDKIIEYSDSDDFINKLSKNIKTSYR